MVEGRNKKVMVFGVFDRLHPGHIYFLEQAGEHGEVIAVVARDSFVRVLKKKMPALGEEFRIGMVKATALVKDAVLGDRELGSYRIVKDIQPDIICLGYDQEALEQDLMIHIKKGTIPAIPLIKLSSFRPHVFHSSFLDAVNPAL